MKIPFKTTLLFFSTIFFIGAPHAFSETPESLRARYQKATPEQRTEIMQERMKQRQSERVARFGGEVEGELTREEWAVAGKAEREAWQNFQTARNRQIRERNQQLQQARNAALRQRREIYSDADLSETEKKQILEKIRREQEAHRARR